MSHDRTVMTEILSKNGVSLERMQTLAKVVLAGSIALAGQGRSEHQNSANDLDLVEWPGKFNSLNGRAEPASVRPFVRRMAV